MEHVGRASTGTWLFRGVSAKRREGVREESSILEEFYIQSWW